MRLEELIFEVSERTGYQEKPIERITAHVFAAIAAAVKRGERVVIPSFGVFKKRTRRGQRVVCNGKEYQSPPNERLGFTPSKHQKRARRSERTE